MQFLIGFLGCFCGIISFWILIIILKLIKNKIIKPKIKKDILRHNFHVKIDEKFLNHEIKTKNTANFIDFIHHYDEEKNYINTEIKFEFYNVEREK